MHNPAFYPHRPATVEMVQTHISYIFIAGDLVYKVKKGVDFGFLDFTTLEKRHYYCKQELRLNQRLAPEIYLSMETISQAPDGAFMWGDEGVIVDYAVKMKKLPEERMLYRLLREGAVTTSVMDAIAHRVFLFHEKAETGGEIDRGGSIETIRHNHTENFEQTEPFINVTISKEQFSFIKQYALSFISDNEPLFEARVARHRIRDCHGDLHLQHICIADSILIFDCIEFNERFRYLDVAAEIAFLAMDLDFNGYNDFSRAFVEAYLKYSKDSEIEKLINFYQCYFAYVRGKVTGFKIHDPAVGAEERSNAIETASRYFNLAFRYATKPKHPALILVAGLMGTGKSVLARALETPLQAKIIRSDVVRKELLDISPRDHHYDDFGKGIYSDNVSEMTYTKIFNLAKSSLQSGVNTIIDASFKERHLRKSALELAHSLGVDFFLLECVCPDEIIKRRLDDRMKTAEDPSDGRWEIFQAQKKDFEPIHEDELTHRHIIIDTSQSPAQCCDNALKMMNGLQ